jgi:hypothetical protein
MTRKVGQVSTSSLELTEGRGPGCGSAASLGWTWWPRSGSMWDLRSREAYVPGALRLLDPVCSIDPESANTWRAYVRNPRPNSHTSGALSGSSRSCRGSGRRDPFPCLCRRTDFSIDLPAGSHAHSISAWRAQATSASCENSPTGTATWLHAAPRPRFRCPKLELQGRGTACDLQGYGPGCCRARSRRAGGLR